MPKGKKPIKPFFFTDAEGNVFKATHVEDEEVVEEPKEEPKEAPKEAPKEEVEDDGEQLSAEEIAILKAIAAERKAALDAEKARKEAEEKAEAAVEAGDGCGTTAKDSTDTQKKPGSVSDSAAGFGSLEDQGQHTDVEDEELNRQIAINEAWQKRYGGK